jgi:hypothetical protein
MEIRGNFGQITELGVYGWAMDVHSQESVEVHLYINGKWTVSGKADMFRKGILKNGIHPTGYCGFQFKFEQMDLEPAPNYEFIVRVGPNREMIGKALYMVGEPVVEEEEQFMFVHIQKTAGTSFRNMLFQLFDEEDIYANKAVMQAIGGGYPYYSNYLAHARKAKRKPKVWVGHVPFITGQYLSSKMKYLCFLRDPLARAISHLIYSFHRQPAAEKLPLENFYEKIKQGELWNLQTRFFADENINKRFYFGGKIPMNEEGLEIAKKHLSSCAFVGIVEAYEASIRLLEQRFNWRFDAIPRHNVTPGKKELPEHIMNDLKNYISYDQELYEFAKTRFYQSLSKAK